MAVDRAHKLRLEVGSYALMHKTGFELMDMLLCCKFAEGDSRILQMKLMRDRLKQVKKDGVIGTLLQMNEEAFAALNLARKLAPAGRDLEKMDELMKENWEDIYDLAELIEERHINKVEGEDFMEPIIERLEAAAVHFDLDWIKGMKYNSAKKI